MTDKRVDLRPLDIGDLGWLIARHGHLYADEFGFDRQFEVDITRKAVALCDKDDTFTRLWIAHIDGTRVASIAISPIEPGVAFLNFLLVMPDFRGQGLAHTLVAHALSHAEHHAFTRVKLETYSCLQSARRLYTELGFVRIGEGQPMQRYGQSFEQEFWHRELPRQSA